MKNRSSYLAALVLLAAASTSCRFGDDIETQLTKYDNVVRNVSFSFKATSNGGSSESVSRAILTDNGLEKGVVSNWDGGDQIALFDFGKLFTSDIDNATELISPEAVCLKQGKAGSLQEYQGTTSNPTDGSVDWAEFMGETNAVITENKLEADNEFALVFPYEPFKEEHTDKTSLQLDYSQQDGSLVTMAKNVLYAWGLAHGKCEDAQIKLLNKLTSCSNDTESAWHKHGTDQSEEILLDNKEAIIRFHVTYKPTEEDLTKGYITNQSLVGKEMPLDEYLKLQNLVISEIVVENLEYEVENGVVDGEMTYKTISVPNIQTANLSLQTGLVTEGAGNAITMNSPTVVHVPETITETAKSYNIDSKGTESESDVLPLTSGSTTVWGTVFYLAVPCPKSRKLEFHPYITIRTKQKAGTAAGPQTFFGEIAPKTGTDGQKKGKELKEGDYYITGRVPLSTSAKHLNGNVDIFLYYNSSFVWNSIDL